MRKLALIFPLLLLTAATHPPATAPAAKLTTAQKRAIAAAERTALFLNKPMVIKGTNLEGKEFSSESLKGKVVLVDFWASWCPDCAKEQPTIVATYKKYHDKGLEIVGISSDVTAADLKDFLQKHPELPWLELWTAPINGRHPLNTEYKLNWIPTTFLIDRNGICRSIEASDELDKVIPGLLEETPK
jgi:thiol-disulfide isomerase/thioredoxin